MTDLRSSYLEIVLETMSKRLPSVRKWIRPINPYPQIVYIPDDVRYCPAYEDRRPRLDCSPTLQDLIEFKTYSEQRLQSLHDQQFFTNLQSVTRP